MKWNVKRQNKPPIRETSLFWVLNKSDLRRDAL